MKHPYIIWHEKLKNDKKLFKDPCDLWNWIEENAEDLQMYEVENKYKKCMTTIIYLGQGKA